MAGLAHARAFLIWMLHHIEPAISSLSSRNMATSRFPTTQFSKEHFVESCGAILLTCLMNPNASA
ncbi:hypothetical protein BJX65DRAFT_204948 [Aspergillus insuetus]